MTRTVLLLDRGICWCTSGICFISHKACLRSAFPIIRQPQSLTLTPNPTCRFSSVPNVSLFSASPLDLRVPLSSSLSVSLLPLSHSRSAAIEIANQLFDLRKLISSEFVMSYSPRRAEEAGAGGRGRWRRKEGPTDRPCERRSLGRTKKMRIVVGRPTIRARASASLRVVHPGGRFRGRQSRG